MEELVKHFAVVNKTTSIVENVIVAYDDFKSVYEAQNKDFALIEYIDKPINDEDVARIGETYIPEVGFIFVSKAVPTIIPKSITMRQARLYLLSLGLLDEVEAIVSQDRAWQIEWEYSSEVLRSNQLISAMQSSLNLTDEAVDNIFMEASKL